MSAAIGRPARPGERFPAPVLVLAAIVSVQFGAAVAAGLIREIGAPATVGIRLTVASLVLFAVARPSLRGRSRRDWVSVGVLGLLLATMNLTFYTAIGRLPLGVVVTIEFLGPLALAAASSRRPADLVAVVLALAGVVAVSGFLENDLSRLDTVGLLFTVAASCAWTGYILATRWVGRRWRQLDGLALAMVLAALVVDPIALALGSSIPLEPHHVAAGAAIAVLSSVIPYSLELIALRRIDTRVFGILLSLEPATAAIAAFLLLGQALVPLEIGGMALVTAASILVMVGQRGAPETEAAEIG